MLQITALPCEVIASIFRKLDNISSLKPSLLSCRHFYSSFNESSGVETDILRRQIHPPLLPYSIALAETRRLPRPLTKSCVRQLLDTLYNDPASLVARLREFTLPQAVVMGRTHDAIHEFALDFAQDAWALLFPGSQKTLGEFTLSPAEYIRFCRAFYRTELFFDLFRTERSSGKPGAFLGSEFELLFSRQPPWENEQVACVHDFLEKRFAQASRDVLSHEISFGELSADYLTLGPMNIQRQHWLAQGVDFIHRVVHAPSWQVQKDLLTSVHQGGVSQLPDVLMEVAEVYQDNDALVEDAITLATDLNNKDKGPSEIWLRVFSDSSAGEWLMFSDNAGLRERAYLFWDLDRIERYQILDDPQSIPVEASHSPSNEDGKRMRESFDARSAIWQKGGSGWWSEGDTSEVVWP